MCRYMVLYKGLASFWIHRNPDRKKKLMNQKSHKKVHPQPPPPFPLSFKPQLTHHPLSSFQISFRPVGDTILANNRYSNSAQKTAHCWMYLYKSIWTQTQEELIQRWGFSCVRKQVYYSSWLKYHLCMKYVSWRICRKSESNQFLHSHAEWRRRIVI